MLIEGYMCTLMYKHTCIKNIDNVYIAHIHTTHIYVYTQYIFIYINRFGTNAFNGPIILLLMIKHIKSLTTNFKEINCT